METEDGEEEGISEAVHAQMQAKWKELSKKRYDSRCLELFGRNQQRGSVGLHAWGDRFSLERSLDSDWPKQ